MITLHGFSSSNYHNIVKHVLIQKGIAFEENVVYPNSTDLVAINPVGKVPAMTTDLGLNISETSVLIEYLEETYTDVPLYPEDLEARALARQIIKVSELYLEHPARRLLPAVFSNVSVSDETVNEVSTVLQRGIRSIVSLSKFSPYVLGETLTVADIYLRYALAIPKMVGPSLLNIDVMEEIPNLSAWDEMMARSEAAKKVDTDKEANTEEFMAYVSQLITSAKKVDD